MTTATGIGAEVVASTATGVVDSTETEARVATTGVVASTEIGVRAAMTEGATAASPGHQRAAWLLNEACPLRRALRSGRNGPSGMNAPNGPTAGRAARIVASTAIVPHVEAAPT